MRRWLFRVDRLSAAVGKGCAYLILLLTALICFEVASRYLFNRPTNWIFDASYMCYGVLFMMAGAYTLSRNGHVRGDFLYGYFPPRLQAGLDLALYLLFFLPGVCALVYAGADFAGDAWRLREHSSVSSDGPPLYHFKTVIPIAGGFLLLQGLVEMARCILCLKDGAWPSRDQDVEEVDVAKLKKMVQAEEAALDAQLGGEGGMKP